MAYDPLTSAELLDLTVEPNWVDLDPDRNQALVLDLSETDRLDVSTRTRLQRWLQSQPAPIIGVGESAAGDLGDLVDCRVASTAELQRVLNRIEQNPVASAVLVQVLRCTLGLALNDALVVESLAYATLQSGREFASWLASYRARRSPAPHVAPDPIVLVDREGDQLRVVLNDVATRNALSVAMRDALTETFKLVAMDASITKVHVSGNGPCFSAGGHLGEFGSADDLAQAHRIRTLRMPARYLGPHAPRYEFRLHGACVGAGIELPAFAGRVTATADTYFRLPELAMGLIPGAGGCVSIPRRIGRQRTAYMALLDEQVSAQTALAWGLIDAIVD